MKNLVKHLKNGMMIALSLLLCLNLSLLGKLSTVGGYNRHQSINILKPI